MPKIPLTVVRSKAELSAVIRNWRYSGQSIGYVPTMGALHNGHVSLIAKSRENATRTVASIYVNPTQFAPGEDFESYPRNENDDLEKLQAAGCDLAYLPTTEEMYPAGSVTNVRVEDLSDLLDGVYRPHFFYGVTTVVARLFAHVQPDFAVFGEKDFQQLQIIRRMVRDLGLPIEIIGGETRREEDGLAQSSRNAYLSADERQRASTLHRALEGARREIMGGATPDAACHRAVKALLDAGFQKVDYIEAVRSDTLQSLSDDRTDWPKDMRLLGAAWMGKTRLIDNIPII